MNRFHRGKQTLCRAAALVLGLSSATTPAWAWDPASTHLHLVESGIRASKIHVQWMEGSANRLGIFTPLFLDPAALTPALRRGVQAAIDSAPDASGAKPLGGPGACPGASAPISTQRYCVEGDLWQLSALGWLRLGVLAQSAPSAQLLQHFVNPRDPGQHTWHADVPKLRTRRVFSHSNGEPFAGNFTASNFAGDATSVLGWVDDRQALWSPSHLRGDLQHAGLAANAHERQAALVLALLRAGALLHAVQDATVPAYARGDVQAFFEPLSSRAGDRGLALQEWVRIHRGRGFALQAALSASLDLPTLSHVRDFYVGTAEKPSLSTFVASHFLSAATLSEPRFIASQRTPTQAAKELLGGNHGLLPAEVQGATLSGWPNAPGYLLNSAGRPLAAYERDEAGRIRLYLDSTIFADQAAYLLPLAAKASTEVLDRIWPSWPQPGSNLPAHLGPATLYLLWQQSDGRRQVVVRREFAAQATVSLPPLPAAPPKDEGHYLYLLLGSGNDHLPFAIERPAVAFEKAAPAATSPVAATSDATATSSDASSSDATSTSLSATSSLPSDSTSSRP